MGKHALLRSVRKQRECLYNSGGLLYPWLMHAKRGAGLVSEYLFRPIPFFSECYYKLAWNIPEGTLAVFLPHGRRFAVAGCCADRLKGSGGDKRRSLSC